MIEKNKKTKTTYSLARPKRKVTAFLFITTFLAVTIGFSAPNNAGYSPGCQQCQDALHACRRIGTREGCNAFSEITYNGINPTQLKEKCLSYGGGKVRCVNTTLACVKYIPPQELGDCTIHGSRNDQGSSD